jgi:hypothetical protein
MTGPLNLSRQMHHPDDLRVRNIFDYLTGCRILDFDVEALFQQFGRAMDKYRSIMEGLGLFGAGAEDELADFIMRDALSAIIYVAPDPSGSLGAFLVHPPAFYDDSPNAPAVHLAVLNRPITLTKDNMLSGIATRRDTTNVVTTTGSHVPLRCLFHLWQAGIEGAPGENQGQYTVYLHRFFERANVQNCYQYIGITKRGWASRFRQHLNEAKSGSAYLFHRALAECTPDKYFTEHHVVAAGMSFEDAMKSEERFVAEHSLNALYPNGLNMIPGGFAGIRFLAARGFRGITPKKWEHRAALVRDFNAYCKRVGKPNAALSLKWTADDFAAKMILSNPNNLNRDQLSRIRTLGSFGMSPKEIARNMEIRDQRVSAILRGATYSRVK